MTGRSNALSFFAGLGQGFQQQEDKERQQKIQQDEIDFRKYERDRMKSADARADTLRADLASAAQAPTALQRPDTADNRDVGSDPTAAPVRTVMPDTPTAQMGRMADVYARSGDAAAAATMRSQAKQSQLADLQLSKAQRDALKQKQWEDINSTIKSPEDLGNYISSTKGDGRGGALKVKTVVDPKTGAITVKQLNDDGTVGPQVGASYPNLAEAKIALADAMTPEMMIAHQHQLATEQQARETLAETGRFHQAQLGLERQRVSLEQARVNAAAKPAADPLAKMTGADQAAFKAAATEREKNAEKIAAALADPMSPVKFDADGKTPILPPGLQMLQSRNKQLEAQMTGLGLKYQHSNGDPIGLNGPTEAAPAPRPHIPGFITPPIAGDTEGQFGTPDRTGAAVPQMGGGGLPATRLAPTDFVAATLKSLGRADPQAADATMRAASAGEQLSAAQQALRAAGSSGDSNKISAAAAAAQQAATAYQQSLANTGGIPPEVVQQLRSQYGAY